MPGSAAKMLDQLAVPEDGRGFASLADDIRWPAGTELPKPEGVFPRHVEEEAAAE
jgi:methionyl-tRNA synthetase